MSLLVISLTRIPEHSQNFCDALTDLPPCNRFMFLCLSASCLLHHPMTTFKPSLQNKNSNNQSSGKCFSPTTTVYNKLVDSSTSWAGGDKSLSAFSFQTPFSRELEFNHNNSLWAKMGM